MTRDVEFVDASISVAEAAATMGDLGVGALPVGTADDLQGILTDRDALFRVVAKGLSNTEVAVDDVMSTTIFSCRQEGAITTALDLMEARNLRRLPVLNANGGCKPEPSRFLQLSEFGCLPDVAAWPGPFSPAESH